MPSRQGAQVPQLSLAAKRPEVALERLAIDALVERDQAAMAEVGAELAQRLEGERRVEVAAGR